MALASLVRRSVQALALLLIAPVLMIVAAVPALTHSSDLNNGKFERLPVVPNEQAAPSNLVRLH